MAKHPKKKALSEGAEMASTWREHTLRWLAGVGVKAPLCVCDWGACPQVESHAGLEPPLLIWPTREAQRNGQHWGSGLPGICGLSHKWQFWLNSNLKAFKWRLTKEKQEGPWLTSNIGRSDTSSLSCQMLDGGRSTCFRESWQITRN